MRMMTTKTSACFAIATLAEFYGVPNDHLMGLKIKSPKYGSQALHLSDDMVALLKAVQSITGCCVRLPPTKLSGGWDDGYGDFC